MPFSVRLADYQKNSMLNICDAGLLGRSVKKDKLHLNISKSYYGGMTVERPEAERLLRGASIINMVGEETVSLSIDLGIGSKNGIKRVDGIPFLIVFKM